MNLFKLMVLCHSADMLDSNQLHGPASSSSRADTRDRSNSLESQGSGDYATFNDPTKQPTKQPLNDMQNVYDTQDAVLAAVAANDALFEEQHFSAASLISLASQHNHALVKKPSSRLKDLEVDIAGTFPFDLERSTIKTGKLLGQGAYGSVYAGELTQKDGTTSMIAVKQLKEGVNTSARVHFLQEAHLLTQFSHPNIVKLVGAVLSSDPLWIVTELCQCSLLEWLRMAEVGNEAYVGCLVDVANGCNYLSSRLFVHRVRAYVHTTDHGEGVFKMAPTIVI